MAAHFPLGGDCVGGRHCAHNICPVFQPPLNTHSALVQLLERPFSTKARHTHTPAERVRGRHTITIWPCSAEEEESSSHTHRQENMLLLFIFVFFPQFFFSAHPLRDHGCHDIISSGHFPWLAPTHLAASSVTWLVDVGDRRHCGFCLLPQRRPWRNQRALINLPPHSTIGDKGTPLSLWQMAAPRGCPRQTLSLFRPRGLMMRPLPLLPEYQWHYTMAHKMQ